MTPSVPAVELIPAQPQDEPVLQNLLQLYLHDFTDFMDWDVDEHGRFSTDDLHSCFTDARRHPFLFVVDGRLAGFAIADAWSVLDESRTGVMDMGEFFVMRKFRRRGAGRVAAQRLFDMFPARWEVRELRGNTGAQAFWRRIIGEYTDGAYDDVETETGFAQSFMSRTNNRQGDK